MISIVSLLNLIQIVFFPQARTLQDHLDEQMNSFRRLVLAKTDSSWNDLESEIEASLKQLQQVNAQMKSLISSGGSEFFSHTLTRHQEILQDFTQVEYYFLRVKIIKPYIQSQHKLMNVN